MPADELSLVEVEQKMGVPIDTVNSQHQPYHSDKDATYPIFE